MIDYITGKIASLTPTSVVIDNSGIGYSMEISLQTYDSLNGKDNANKEKVEETNTNVEVENSTPQMQESTLDTPF